MADHHLGNAVSSGGVVAYRELVSPSGVDYDIGCGNKAIRTDADASEVRQGIGPIMNDVFETISLGVGRKNEDEPDRRSLRIARAGTQDPSSHGGKIITERGCG
jgi:tRNA-splicing ligase RtcB